MLTDTHCHIHEASYPLEREAVLQRGREAGVEILLCVGTNRESSQQAIEFAAGLDGVFASIGVHPHDTKDGYDIADLAEQPKVVAVGEIGLDYFYTHSPRETQIAALEAQIQVALRYDLPIIFHVREAFDDFWPIFDKYPGLCGELHSFTDSKENLDKALERGLYIGVNGISTFTKDETQKAVFDAIPLDRLLFETDAPFLTPAPFRGKINEPAYMRNIAQYHADRRGISLEEIARMTSQNAQTLFAY